MLFPGDLPNPGIESGSPALWVNSLETEAPGKPKRWFTLLLFLSIDFFPRIWGKAKANQSYPFSEDCSDIEGLQ